MALSCLISTNLFNQQFNNKSSSSWTLVNVMVIVACLTVHSEVSALPIQTKTKACHGESGILTYSIGDVNLDGNCICGNGGDWILTQAGSNKHCDCDRNGMSTCFAGLRIEEKVQVTAAELLSGSSGKKIQLTADASSVEESEETTTTSSGTSTKKFQAEAEESSSPSEEETSSSTSIKIQLTEEDSSSDEETEQSSTTQSQKKATSRKFQKSSTKLATKAAEHPEKFQLADEEESTTKSEGSEEETTSPTAASTKKVLLQGMPLMYLNQPSCSNGKVYDECASCVQTCSDLLNNLQCTGVCTGGCTCPSGYKEFEGKCVLDSECMVVATKRVQMKKQNLSTTQSRGEGASAASSKILFLQLALIVVGGICFTLCVVVVLLVRNNKNNKDVLLDDTVPTATGAMFV